MVEGSCYINERSLLHLRYLSSWQFMSLVKTYQSFPIIFKEVSCHLHCQEHSFLTSSRPVERARRDYDTLTLNGDSNMSQESWYISTEKKHMDAQHFHTRLDTNRWNLKNERNDVTNPENSLQYFLSISTFWSIFTLFLHFPGSCSC